MRKKNEEKVYGRRGPGNIHPEILERSDMKRIEASYRQALEQELLEKACAAYMEAVEKVQ
jgi:hypothetical protein